MKTITRHLRLIKMFFSFRMSNQMIYRASFWTAFFVDVSLFMIHLAVFQTLFFNVDSINGWSKYQMVFFVGTFTLIDGLEMWLYFFGVTGIPMKIREGKLDIYLTKPVNTLFWLTFENMDIGSAFICIPGIIMIVTASINLGIRITLWKVLGYILLLILMLLLLYSLMLIIRSLSFFFIKTGALDELEGELISICFRVPGVVFRGITKLILYVLLPYALIATIPTQFFTDVLSGGMWLLVLGVVTAFVLLSRWIWRMGLRRYGSASS
ncbi:MAG TPA: ABC-2 family transporter protein [Thermoclostridium caenicola]|nr:ABC-2 family transporter protein [Thermoclostridium caenicola]